MTDKPGASGSCLVCDDRQLMDQPLTDW